MTTWEYDDLNRLAFVKHERGQTLLGSFTYTLDDAGHRRAVTETLTDQIPQTTSRTIQYDYDDLYRLTGESYSDASGGPVDESIAYTYDAVGNRQTLRHLCANGDLLVNYDYNERDQLTRETHSASPQACAAVGCPIHMAAAGGSGDRGAGGPGGSAARGSDEHGRHRAALADRHSHGGWGARFGAGLATVSWFGAVLMTLWLAVSRALWHGRRGACAKMWHGRTRPWFGASHCSRGSGTPTRREQRRRLRRCAVLAYIIPLFVVGPENIQNWFVGLFIESALADQVTTTVYTYAHDANGNLVEKRQLIDDQGDPNDPNNFTVLESWTYDARNRLVQYDPDPEGGATEAHWQQIVTYTYDTEGIRQSKSVGGVTTRYITDANRDYAQVLLEVDADSGNVNVRYVYGDDLVNQTRDLDPDPGTDDLQRRWHHHDGQMSVRQLTTDAGVIADAYRYYAFGLERDVPASHPVANVYRYTGEQFDTESGQYYLRARYYAADTGRFTRRDPFAGISDDPSTLHKYAYVGNDAQNGFDPGGLWNIANLVSTQGIQSLLQRSSFVLTNIFRRAIVKSR